MFAPGSDVRSHVTCFIADRDADGLAWFFENTQDTNQYPIEDSMKDGVYGWRSRARQVKRVSVCGTHLDIFRYPENVELIAAEVLGQTP